MKSTLKKFLAVSLTCALTLGLTACNQSGGDNNNNNNGNEDGEITRLPEQTAPPIDENAPTGHLVHLTYDTTFEKSNQEALKKFEQLYGGTIEVKLCGSNDAYFTALGTLITTGSSPDLVRYEWRSFPHGMSYNIYTPLDSYIDINSDRWKDIKDIADQFVYNGKHYYMPYRLSTNFAINYNSLVLQEANLEDPVDLLNKNEWTWTKFEELLTKWCNMDSKHVGYTGVGGMSFVLTTGHKIIDVVDNQIINNLNNSDIGDCMAWLEKLRKNGLIGVTETQGAETNHVTGFEAPQDAFVDGNLLFLGMDPHWTYTAAKEALWGKNIDEEMKFVPFPRSDKADKYYHGIDSFGFLIPSGAPNVKGAVDWINFLRDETIDPENIAKEKKKALDDTPDYNVRCMNKDCGDTSENADSKGRHLYTDKENEDGITECPVCGTAREEIYKVVWDSDAYDLYQELQSATGRFTMLFDHCYGFNNNVNKIISDGDEPVIDGPMRKDLSFVQLRDAYYDTLEAYLDEYRELLKQNAAGNLVTMPIEATADTDNTSSTNETEPENADQTEADNTESTQA